MKKIIIYPGRYQPALQHHAQVYKHLQGQFPGSDVYVASTDKTDGATSPFNFNEKKQIISALGIPANRILQVRNPYNKDDYAQYFDENSTALIIAVGEKDLDRFPFNNVDPKTELDMSPKVVGQPKYFQKINTYSTDPRPMSERGYITLVPTITSDTDEAASASAFRLALSAAPDVEAAKEIVAKQYGQHNEKIFNLLYQKIKGTSEMKKNEDAAILEGFFDSYKKSLANGIAEGDNDAHGEECPKCNTAGCEECDWTGYKPLPSWDVNTEQNLGETAEEYDMNEDIARMRHLAGLAEAPVEFDKPKPRKKAVPHKTIQAKAMAQHKKSGADRFISPKDQRDAASRPGKAMASNPSTAKFLPPTLSDVKHTVANFFPANVDINDPAIKKENFLKALQKAPALLFGEINARLANDDNSMAVGDRISGIVQKLESGKNIMSLDPEDKEFALKLVGNAINSLELQRNSGDEGGGETDPDDDFEIDNEYDDADDSDDSDDVPDADAWADEYDDESDEVEEAALVDGVYLSVKAGHQDRQKTGTYKVRSISKIDDGHFTVEYEGEGGKPSEAAGSDLDEGGTSQYNAGDSVVIRGREYYLQADEEGNLWAVDQDGGEMEFNPGSEDAHTPAMREGGSDTSQYNAGDSVVIRGREYHLQADEEGNLWAVGDDGSEMEFVPGSEDHHDSWHESASQGGVTEGSDAGCKSCDGTGKVRTYGTGEAKTPGEWSGKCKKCNGTGKNKEQGVTEGSDPCTQCHGKGTKNGEECQSCNGAGTEYLDGPDYDKEEYTTEEVDEEYAHSFSTMRKLAGLDLKESHGVYEDSDEDMEPPKNICPDCEGKGGDCERCDGIGEVYESTDNATYEESFNLMKTLAGL